MNFVKTYMPSSDKKIALFCGALRLPFIVRDCLRQRGFDVYVIGLKNFYDPALQPDLVVRLGGGGVAARECKKRGIKKLVFAGALGHVNLSDIRPDMWSMSVFMRVLANQKGANSMLSTAIAGIESKGFKIVGAQELCPDLAFQPGIQTRVKPTREDRKTIDRAVQVSKMIGAEDIGQSVVVDRQVLAIEAAEGTTKMFQRVIEVKNQGATPLERKAQSGIFAKMTKPNQDLRVDLPAIGVDTVRDVTAARLRGIVVNAGTCLVIDRDQVVTAADKAGIFIIAV